MTSTGDGARALAGILAILLTVALAALWWHALQPVPHCRIINGREIETHHCIPYCPPDPKECN